MLEELEERLQLKEKIAELIELVKLVGILLFMAHFVACLWHYIALLENESGSIITWLGNEPNIFQQDWESRYVDSLYFVIVTMSTLGYGDICPKTTKEKIFTIFFVLFSCFTFAYAMNSIGDILKNYGKKQKDFNRKIANLNIYMRKNQLSNQLQIKVRKYFEYLNNEIQAEYDDGANMFSELSEEIKNDAYIDIYGKMIQSKKIFKENFSQNFINAIALKIQEKKYGIEEVIYKNGDDSNKLYFILKGEVEIINNHSKNRQQQQLQMEMQMQMNNQALYTFKKGDMFGEIGFFTNYKRAAEVKSKNVSIIAYLELNDFLLCLKDSPQDYEQYIKIKENITLYQDSSGFETKCAACQSISHPINICPFITYVRDKKKLLMQYKANIQKERINKERDPDKKKIDWKNLKYLYECAINYRFQLQQENKKNQQNSDSSISDDSSSFDEMLQDIPIGTQNELNDSQLSGENQNNNNNNNQKNILGIQTPNLKNNHKISQLQSKQTFKNGILFNEILNNQNTQIQAKKTLKCLKEFEQSNVKSQDENINNFAKSPQVQNIIQILNQDDQLQLNEKKSIKQNKNNQQINNQSIIEEKEDDDDQIIIKRFSVFKKPTNPHTTIEKSQYSKQITQNQKRNSMNFDIKFKNFFQQKNAQEIIESPLLLNDQKLNVSKEKIPLNKKGQKQSVDASAIQQSPQINNINGDLTKRNTSSQFEEQKQKESVQLNSRITHQLSQKNPKLEDDQFYILMDFDKAQIFQSYFPYNNLNTVLRGYNNWRKQSKTYQELFKQSVYPKKRRQTEIFNMKRQLQQKKQIIKNLSQQQEIIAKLLKGDNLLQQTIFQNK